MQGFDDDTSKMVLVSQSITTFTSRPLPYSLDFLAGTFVIIFSDYAAIFVERVAISEAHPTVFLTFPHFRFG